MTDAVRRYDVMRVEAGDVRMSHDAVAAEVPLEVRLGGEAFSVIMRTPGADRELAVGFLFSEGVIGQAADVVRVDLTPDGRVADVVLAPERARAIPDLLRTRRQVTMNSSCGMCGRRELESLDRQSAPLRDTWRVPGDVVLRLPAGLRGVQPGFDETGGLHAAGLFDRLGRLEGSAEDVGRHNAVDKLVGRMILAGRLPLEDSLLFVSGRLSFEIVQKAYLAGVPLLAAVSAPSSLAIDLAADVGMTLIGFVRDERFTVYANGSRLGA